MWAGYEVFRGKLGGFVIAARQKFQGLRQLVEDLWVDYLMGGSTVQNPC